MAAVTIHSDFGVQENKVCYCLHFFCIYFHEVMGPHAMIFVLWMLSFKPAFSLSSFTVIKSFFKQVKGWLKYITLHLVTWRLLMTLMRELVWSDGVVAWVVWEVMKRQGREKLFFAKFWVWRDGVTEGIAVWSSHYQNKHSPFDNEILDFYFYIPCFTKSHTSGC